MTYLAPRQGLFAIIILISFLIHATLLLISTDQQLDKLKMQTGERMLVQLVKDVELPLLSKDKVSLSVKAGRYTSESTVASLTVKDIDDEVLLQTGQAQLLRGDELSKKVILGDSVIGTVTLTMRDTSKGEIIASQWLFILGSFIVHLLLWLAYGYIARPTKAQLTALSRDVEEHLLRQRGSLPKHQIRRGEETENSLEVGEDLGANEKSRSTGLSGFNVQKAVNQYVQSHQDDVITDNNDNIHDGLDAVAKGDYHVADSLTAQNNSHVITPHEDHSDDVNSHTNHSDTNNNNSNDNGLAVAGSRPKLVANRKFDVACVQIKFDDPYHLINTLAPEQSRPYFALCSQLLEQTLVELLKQPLLFGVKVVNKPTFTANGAMVELSADTSYSKIGLAAVMLAKVYVMLNQVICLKHRELKRFSSDVYVGVSDDAVTEHVEHLLENNGKANDIFVLLPVDGIKQLSGNIQLRSLENPTTVYERDSAYLEGTSDAIMKSLVNVRNAVLLSGK